MNYLTVVTMDERTFETFLNASVSTEFQAIDEMTLALEVNSMINPNQAWDRAFQNVSVSKCKTSQDVSPSLPNY